MKRFIALILTAAFGLTLAGCNTMEGVGEDVQAGGKKLERSAEQNKKY